jgi:hypothetical protein
MHSNYHKFIRVIERAFLVGVDLAASLGPLPIQRAVPSSPFTLPPRDLGLQPAKGPPALKQDLRLNSPAIGPDGAGSPFVTRTSGPAGVRVNTTTDEFGRSAATAVRVVGSQDDTKFTITGGANGFNGSATAPIGKNVTVNGSIGVNPNQNAGIGVDPTPVTIGGRVTLGEGSFGAYVEGSTDQLNQIKSGSNRTEAGIIFNPSGPAGSDDNSRGLVGVTAGISTVNATDGKGGEVTSETVFVRANTSIGPIGIDARLDIPSNGAPMSGGVTLSGGDSAKGGGIAGGGSVSPTGETMVWIGYVNNDL